MDVCNSVTKYATKSGGCGRSMLRRRNTTPSVSPKLSRMVLRHAHAAPARQIPPQTKLLFRCAGLVKIGRPRPKRGLALSVQRGKRNQYRDQHYKLTHYNTIRFTSRDAQATPTTSKVPLSNLDEKRHNLRTRTCYGVPQFLLLSLTVWPFVFNWENGLSGERGEWGKS